MSGPVNRSASNVVSFPRSIADAAAIAPAASSVEPWSRRAKAARVRQIAQRLLTLSSALSPAALDDVEAIVRTLARAARHRAAGDFRAANELEQLIEAAVIRGGGR